jgi:hypothetical protein
VWCEKAAKREKSRGLLFVQLVIYVITVSAAHSSQGTVVAQKNRFCVGKARTLMGMNEAISEELRRCVSFFRAFYSVADCRLPIPKSKKVLHHSYNLLHAKHLLNIRLIATIKTVISTAIAETQVENLLFFWVVYRK